jgi:hypothetical protein
LKAARARPTLTSHKVDLLGPPSPALKSTIAFHDDRYEEREPEFSSLVVNDSTLAHCSNVMASRSPNTKKRYVQKALWYSCFRLCPCQAIGTADGFAVLSIFQLHLAALGGNGLGSVTSTDGYDYDPFFR